MKNILHSIVVPVYQSRSSLENLTKRIFSVMSAAGIRYELILVDDGSADDSYSEIKRLAAASPNIRGFRLSRNFGQQAALLVGFQKARGDYIAVIDDDLQDAPEVLIQFFQALDNHYDVAYGVRRKRKEKFTKRVLYAGFYHLLQKLSSINIPLDAGDFCAMKRPVLNAMLELRSSQPFLRGARAWAGFKQIGIEYERAARDEGESGYTLRKYFKLAFNGILSFSHIPLRLTTYLGLLTATLCVLFLIWVTINWLLGTFHIRGYTSMILLITFFGSVQLISIGIIGEYIGKLLDETRKWPVAFVAESTEKENLPPV